MNSTKIGSLILELKHDYMSVTGEKTCDISKMISVLKENGRYRLFAESMAELFSLIECTYKDNYVLLRYTDFTTVYNAMTPEKYWSYCDGIYRECRSLVLDIENEKTILHGYDKFFNVGELQETSIDIVRWKVANARVFEVTDKLDGSMLLATMTDSGDIVTATSHSLNADTSWHLELGNSMLYTDENIIHMMRDYKGYTFVFEMISEFDPHVVKYDKSENGLYLIGIRTSRGVMMYYRNILEIANEYNVRSTVRFDMSLDDILNSRDSKHSDEAEGFVVRVDDDFYKIKYTEYVMMHKILGSIISSNAVIDAIARDVFDDFCSRVPDSYKARVYQIADTVYTCENELIKYAHIMARTICAEHDNIADRMRAVNSIPKMLQSCVRNAIVGRSVSLFAKNYRPKLNYIEDVLSLIKQQNIN